MKLCRYGTVALLITSLFVPARGHAISFVVDPTNSSLTIDSARPTPLTGRLELSPPPLLPVRYGIDGLSLQSDSGRIEGPERLDFMGHTEVLGFQVLDFFSSTFSVVANVELLDVDGDRALFRYLQLRSSGPGSVSWSFDGTDFAEILIEATVTLREQWWSKDPNPCPRSPRCNVQRLVLDETLVEREIGTAAIRALPIPEPGGAWLFAAGALVVGARLRRGATRRATRRAGTRPGSR